MPVDYPGEAAVKGAAEPSWRKRLGGLTGKQALATLVVVFALSVLGAAYEALDTWHASREQAVREVRHTASLIETGAVEAAYKLSPRLAQSVVANLAERRRIARAELLDNFGGTLAAAENDIPADAVIGPPALAEWLFGDVTRHNVTLIQGDGDSQEVGRLNLRLSAQVLAADFYEHVLRAASVGALRALGICVLVVGIFYVLITRPLLRISGFIAAVDPARPGQTRIPVPRGHSHDELGQLVASLNDLMAAFQDGLDRRDAAERELNELNQALERRVSERTHALQSANQELEQKKAESDRALAELERAHVELHAANARILESLRYARRIQAAMLPDSNALADHLGEAAMWWEPLHEVGGDYFWVQRLGRYSVVVVADCTGHGVPGAFMTLIVASALDRILHEADPDRPSDILHALDAAVRQRLRQDTAGAAGDEEADDGLEAGVCVWDPDNAKLTFAGAGLPLLYMADGRIAELRGDRAYLGYRSLRGRRPIRDQAITLEPGTTCYLFTDGVCDQMGQHRRRLFGRRALARAFTEVADQPLERQVAHIQQVLSRYRGDEPKRDDITLIAFRPGPREP